MFPFNRLVWRGARSCRGERQRRSGRLERERARRHMDGVDGYRPPARVLGHGLKLDHHQRARGVCGQL